MTETRRLCTFLLLIPFLQLPFADSLGGGGILRNEREETSAAILGTGLVIECPVKKHPVKWTKNGRILPDATQHILKIADVKEDSGGLYVCSKKSQASFSFHRRIIVLPDHSSLTYVAVIQDRSGLNELLNNSLSNQTVITLYEGDDNVRLVCLHVVPTILSHMKNDYHWIRPLQPQRSRDYIQRMDKEYSTFISVLSLKTVDRSEDGESHRCNGFQIFIEVDYPPTFTINRIPRFGIPILEGMSVSLQCKADVEPKEGLPKYWLKDEVPMNSSLMDGILRLESVSAFDTGWYQCLLTHKGENHTSIGYFLNVQPTALGERNNTVGVMLDEDEEDVYSNCSKQAGRKLFVRSLNESSIEGVAVARVKGSERAYLSMEICSKFQLLKSVWITPDGRAARSKEGSGVYSHKLYPRGDCVLSTLEIPPSKRSEGEYSFWVKDAKGQIAEASIQLQILLIPPVKELTSSEVFESERMADISSSSSSSAASSSSSKVFIDLRYTWLLWNSLLITYGRLLINYTF